jgi:hypothetical protein
MQRTLPLVQAAFQRAGIGGIPPGALRNFARLALQANGIYPPGAKKKPKVKPKPAPVQPGGDTPGGMGGISAHVPGGTTTTGPGGIHVQIPGGGLPA